eukprot:jgi/Botrbrau1/7555/Bobra.0159s0005.1
MKQLNSFSQKSPTPAAVDITLNVSSAACRVSADRRVSVINLCSASSVAQLPQLNLCVSRLRHQSMPGGEPSSQRANESLQIKF